ncbi:MAG: IS30 family transposase [bacterium]|nr:IS30 family transposase [bacterium]
MQYQHFSIEEREEVQLGLWRKESIRSIALRLDRSPSSIAREIKRNLPAELYRYTSRLAHEHALEKRKKRGREERLKNERIRVYVIEKLKLRWSPEQISGRMRIDCKERISHEAIYQYIYAQIHRNGWGELKRGREDLRPYLRRRRKRRIRKGARKCQRVEKPQGMSIDYRPAVVDRRTRIGDWESDTVESKDHKPGLNTLVERKTGLLCMTKLHSKTSAATIAAIANRMNPLPPKMKRTMTFDNGPENSDWQTLETLTGLAPYFCHAYHSWERGTNENTNGLIRDYYPKRTDFDMIREEEIQYVEYLLNTRPRKRHGWKTPLEVASVALQG